MNAGWRRYDDRVRALEAEGLNRSDAQGVADAEILRDCQNATAEYREAMLAHRDAWVPACGGRETPFRDRAGRTLLYCWNPGQLRHAYIDLGTDMETAGPDEVTT